MTATKKKFKTEAKPAIEHDTQTEVAQLRSQLERYESFFGELDSFISFVRDEKSALKEATAAEAEAKAVYDEAKAHRRSIEESISGAKESLYRIVEPGPMKVLPLFDRMEPADPERHGENAETWRLKPIADLRLSVKATQFLNDADIVAIGQLQDRVLASASWWESIDGFTTALAAAVADKLNDYIFRDGIPE